jgi:hypothetical protein
LKGRIINQNCIRLFSDTNTKLTLSYENSPIEGAFVSKIPKVNFISIFSTNAKHLLRTKFLMILIATAFGKNVPNMVLGAKAVA